MAESSSFEPLAHEAAGGWRRGVLGLFVGLLFGGLVRAVLGDRPARP